MFGPVHLQGRFGRPNPLPSSGDSFMKRVHLAGLALLTLAAACGGDDGGPSKNPPAAVAYAGTFASDGSSGTILFSTAPAALHASLEASLSAPIELVGTMTFSDNSTVDLTGLLDGNDLGLAGGDYALVGTLSGGVISGEFTGPNGETGSFSASVTTNGAQVALYCGTYDGDDSGVFSLALKPDRSGGVIVVPSNGDPGQTGRARAKSGTSDQIEVLPDAAPSVVIAIGSLFAIDGTAFDSVAGEWDDGENVGTFGGSTRCQVAESH